MISFESSGSFDKTEAFLMKLGKGDIYKALTQYGEAGVAALSAATPVDTGETANMWRYEIKHERGSHSITWFNGNVVDGVPVAIMLQYGHGTGTGGYVQGRDFINPAIQPIFDKLATEVWRAVTSA